MKTILLTVYQDAVRVEINNAGQRTDFGWFEDEIAALCAAFERLLLDSAILANLRQLPETTIRCKYWPGRVNKRALKFRRATRVKRTPSGRRVVMVSGIANKPWMRTSLAQPR